MGDVSKLMALKSMMGQQQLQSQEIQQHELDLQDQQTLRALAPKYLQKDSNGRPTGFDADNYFNDALSQGVNPKTIAQTRNLMAEASKNLAQAGTAQIDLQKAKNERAYQIGEGVRSLTDPVAQQAAYEDAKPQIAELGLDTTKMPPQYPGDAGMKQWEATLGVHAQVLSDAETLAKTNASNSKAALDQANAFLAQNKADVINLYRQNPNALLSQIDAIFPPQTAQNSRYRFGVQQALATGDVDAAKEWIKQASNEKAGLEKESFTQNAENVRQALNRQAMQSNELQKSGLNSLDKMFTDPQHGYSQFLAQANSTKTALADAKDGNELAASLAPLMTVLGVNSFAGIHRVNPQEIAAAGPAVGSLYRRANTILDKAVSGSMNEDTRKEMGAVIDGLIEAKHASLVPSAQMVARNAGLDPSKTSVLDKDGSMTTLDKVVAGPAAKTTASAPPAGATHTAMGSDGQRHYTNAKGEDLGIAPSQ